MLVDQILTDLSRVSPYKIYGRVTAILGILVEVGGIERDLAIGSRCRVIGRGGDSVVCEVVGFRAGRALLMPFGSLDGIGVGCKAELAGAEAVVYPDVSWLGRVVDGLAKPIDGGGPLRDGAVAYPYRNTPPPAHARNRVGGKLDLGVRAINTFLTCCRGQRMGIFSASGVGKSILLSMLARFTDSDVNVIGLIGERGREVQEFITDHLGPEGLARTVVVVATSDQSPLMRRQAALLTLSVAEYFRDLGKDVLCLMDSVTRFAMAQREIGLSAGEPPASKGYTPTVFAELPRLLERAGPGVGAGSITGLFTVLVEGDDHNEPISDAVRGILDGHIVLDRAIAERGRFPAINVLRSLSRTMPGCNSTEENAIVRRARESLAEFEDMAEMIRLGAYREGSNEKVDRAIHHQPMLEKYLAQDMWERSDIASGYSELAEIMNVAADPAVADEAEADPTPEDATA